MKLNRLSKPVKLALGFATIWPYIYMPLFFLVIFGSLLSDGSTSSEVPTGFLYILPLHFLTIIGGLVVLGLFIYDLFKNEHIDSDKRALWAVVLFLGGFIATPVYWYLYVWKKPTSRPIKKTRTKK